MNIDTHAIKNPMIEIGIPKIIPRGITGDTKSMHEPIAPKIIEVSAMPILALKGGISLGNGVYSLILYSTQAQYNHPDE